MTSNINNSKNKTKYNLTNPNSLINKLSEKKKTVVDELISKKIKTETLPGESKNFSCNLSLEKII